MGDSSPDYRCPGCNEESRLIIGPEQAFCRNTNNCRVLSFNPSLPDGGLSEAGVIDLTRWNMPKKGDHGNE